MYTLTETEQRGISRLAAGFASYDFDRESSYYAQQLNSHATSYVNHWYGDIADGTTWHAKTWTERHEALKSAIIAAVGVLAEHGA